MAASTRFLSAVAVAFVAGVASTSAYMSRGDADKDAPGAPPEATPALAERLRAEAHGQSLPWSEPVKAKPVPSKLTFTPGPADATAKKGWAVADEGRASSPQAAPLPAPVRPPDDGGRSRVRLAQSHEQTPSPEDDQADPMPAIRRAPPSKEDVGPSRAKMVEAPGPARTSRDDSARAHIKLAQSSRPASQPGEEAGHPHATSAETPRHVPPLVEEERTRISVAEALQRARATDAGDKRSLVRAAEGTRQGRSPEQGDERPRVRAVDAPRLIRPSEEGDRPRTRMAEAPPRVRPLDTDQERTRLKVAEAPRRLRAPDPEDDGYPRVRAAEAQRSAHRSRPVPSRNLPSLAAADGIRAAVRRTEAHRERVTVAPPYRTASLEDRDATPRVREIYVRRDDEPDDEPRVRVRRSVAASDGLMRWLSGPDGRF